MAEIKSDDVIDVKRPICFEPFCDRQEKCSVRDILKAFYDRFCTADFTCAVCCERTCDCECTVESWQQLGFIELLHCFDGATRVWFRRYVIRDMDHVCDVRSTSDHNGVARTTHAHVTANRIERAFQKPVGGLVCVWCSRKDDACQCTALDWALADVGEFCNRAVRNGRSFWLMSMFEPEREAPLSPVPTTPAVVRRNPPRQARNQHGDNYNKLMRVIE